MNLRLTLCMLTLVLAGSARAQTLQPAKIELYATDTLDVPQTAVDHFPYLQMDLSHTNLTFVLAICKYRIEWADPDNPDETFEATFADLAVTTADGEPVPIASSMTVDQRMNFFRKPGGFRMEASEKRNQNSIRFGAVFLANEDNKQFTLSFAGTSQEVTCAPGGPPSPARMVEVEILESFLTQSIQTGNSQIERALPAAQIQLSTPAGQLLCVRVRIEPQAPNVNGSDMRYIFRPSDFTLKTDNNIQRILGFKDRNFLTDSIYNLSRQSLEELPEAAAEITLIFNVPDGFSHGELAFMGTPVGEISPAP